jgi:hypothetical protein
MRLKNFISLASSKYPTKLYFSLLGCNYFLFSSGMPTHASIPKTHDWLNSMIISMFFFLIFCGTVIYYVIGTINFFLPTMKN